MPIPSSGYSPLWRLYGIGGIKRTKNQPDGGYSESEWYPRLMSLLYGKVGGMTRDFANQNISQLARLLGGQFARQNIAIPSGTQAIARKYLAGQNQINPLTQLDYAQKLAGLMAPGFQSWWQGKGSDYTKFREPGDYLGKYLNMIWGGGR